LTQNEILNIIIEDFIFYLIYFYYFCVMGKGKEIINLALHIANDKCLLLDAYKITTPFKNKEDEIDLMSICKLEVLLDEKLLLIPTTTRDWRKIKLTKLNKIINKKL